ncbi:50S ribosomal protein L18e [Candidatus Woesearchaeota archaeon]|nr:50S ribosomal protein L18e [Candidatus Woesearchaeota archaeon]
MRKTGPTNPQMRKLIANLRSLATKEKVDIWKRIADELEKPTRSRREVNLERISRNTKKGETIIVPGKVLAKGELEHSLKVAAWNFSETAKQKINKNGKASSIQDLIKENPKGKGVRIIG